MLRIASVSQNQIEMCDALASIGVVTQLENPNELDISTVDLFVVDCREQTIEHAFTGITQSLECIPLIIIINAQQVIAPGGISNCIDEVVTFDDFGSTAFQWRLQTLLQRYRFPLRGQWQQTPELRLFQEITNHVSDWVIIKDLEHRFVFASNQFATIVGLPMKSIIGKNDLEIGTDPEAVLGNPDTGWPGFWAQDDAVIAGGAPVFEENRDWRAFSVSRRYKRTERVPLRNASGEIYALLVSSSDITDRVLAERNLQARNVMLRRVTEEKSKAIQHQLVAEQAISAKNKFLAAASHDLRQPLHALGLFLTVLERRLSKAADKEVLNKIRLSSDALNALFNSLLDISRLDAGVVEVVPKTLPVSEILDSISEEFIQLGADRNLDVRVDLCDAVVTTDPVLFSRILRNLLQNAITHTQEGSVRVSCTKSSGKLHIEIADTGPGIPEHEHETVFSEYYQLDNNLERATKGLGLGLAIVSRLADLLDVNIELDSVPGQGSRFTVSVALGKAHDIENKSQPLDFWKLSGHHVLIIDDEPDIREGLKLLLDAFNCDSWVAESAKEAIDILRGSDIQPDVMIVDYRLKGGLRGDTEIDRIREHFQQYIPAIIVTGDTSKERLRDANDAGCHLLHKPVSAKALVETIVTVLDEQLVMDS